MPNRLWVTLALFALVLALPVGVSAQESSEIKQLLTEMRALRESVERSLSTSVRVQIIFGKLELHGGRLERAQARLEITRTQVRDIVEDITAVDEATRKYEEMVATTNDQKQQELLGAAVRDSQARRARLETERNRLQAEHTEAENSVAMEQTQFSTLNRQLEDIERAFTRPPQQK